MMCENLKMAEIEKDLCLSGFENKFDIELNTKKILLNGMDNKIFIRNNYGLFFVNGLRNEVVIENDYSGLIINNGVKNNIKGIFLLFLDFGILFFI